ncbi:MAG: hypothetical protein WBA74_11730 [Cyclobacteriaceae bacterium]
MKTKFIVVLLMLCAFYQANAQRKKVAVVTFYVNKHIGFEALGGGAALAGSIASLSEDPKFDLTSVLNNFHDVFFTEYAEQFPFDLLPEEEVLNNAEYQDYVSNFGETNDEERDKLFQQYITYEGYKPLIETASLGNKNLKAKSNEMRMLEIFEGKVDGVMFVYLDYGFVKKSMGLAAGIQAYARMKLWNTEGKKVFKINEVATSKKSVPVVAGVPVMKVDKLLPLCENASEELIEDLGKRLKKIAGKADKKL